MDGWYLKRQTNDIHNCYHFYLVVDPLQPSGALRAAVDQDETVHHGRPPVSQTNQNIGPETNTEPDAVTDAEIVDHILDLKNKKNEQAT